jgi:CheY-like chemotaxis protein
VSAVPSPADKGVDAPATVLLVDDDADARDSVGEMLEDEGFVVRMAQDGFEALDRLSEQPRPVAMVLDLQMPRMGGHEVLRRLQQRRDLASIPVCVLSGALDKKTALPSGAALAIPKPLLLHRLVQILAWLRACANSPSPRLRGREGVR